LDYRGDIGVILINHGTEDFIVNQGDRIAQLVITKYEQVEFNIVDTLEETERGEGGFGHTGK
jgi:dUTP pyrophosphatase